MLTGRRLLLSSFAWVERKFRLHFLPDVMENTEEVYLRSSNRTRTIESLQQVIHGLFPLDKQGQFFVPHICVRSVLLIFSHRSVGLTSATRNKRDENLYPNTSACQRLNTLMDEFAKGMSRGVVIRMFWI